MFDLAQTERMLEITSPLGADKLMLRRLSVQEAIGHPFSLTAEVLSQDLNLQPSSLIGKAVTCTIKVRHVEPRHFHGVVRAFSRIGAMGRGLASYRIEVVPNLWHLSRTADCRIFQDKSVKTIVSTVLSDSSVAPVRWGGSVPTAARTYCVQFNETDLDFVQRMLDETGCGYYFEHKASEHTLVVCGANGDYPLIGGDPQVVRSDAGEVGTLTDWKPVSSLQPGKVVAEDFDGLKPASLLQKQTGTILSSPNASKYEIYHWPSGQTVRPEGDLAKLGMEVYETVADRISATGNDPTIFAGGRLKVRPGIDETAAVTWLVAATRHEAFDETHLSGGGASGYSNNLVLMPADRPWRPADPRPRPPMLGVHSAVVTGPSGEEIHCDEYGRIKVHFLWDRAGKRDDTSSCWVRVAQSFAGKWGGSWTLPRVGDEVLVAFENGDPDRPIAIGSVYNAEQKPIYSLPANKTQSGFKTRSSKGGGAANFNELRFEDKKGSEEINIQAEKDMTLLIKNDRTETIKRHRTETVDGKHTETTKLDRTATVTQGNDKLTIDMGNLDRLVKMGNITEKASMGTIKYEAMQSITLTCGQSKIHMTPMSISIESLQIDVKASLALNTQGLMATHKADAMLTLKGGLVMIN
ncbi:type VI secretion system Vgr family protein [Roseococcus pinisoli]|uniref:type VI secretion system Vgr family protein n=1 Tax=Roseococcus pinisoli TaxID=2835040 RepID=UPI0028D17C81|nr:type VI secretion system tip protein TssI/VgrG [uncultured Roseococcus sp.]